MLFLVIERFRPGSVAAIGERFQRQGRMLPEGVIYHASWVDPAGSRCYQIMEAPDVDALSAWTRHWDDLVEFELIPVVTSSEFWEQSRHKNR
jgi:hypothetical protein